MQSLLFSSCRFYWEFVDLDSVAARATTASPSHVLCRDFIAASRRATLHL
ncbi:hypothetical protein BIW11_09388 [Tropilaelaps mercedesae]|uniref:Uncharacterized protein n=1 Tax=Tropilaelaps mercedesae TaxID=418985 RepID=A0A1V9XKB4_9ACAR|nr:hypothetical protein BIW11_09388 [Tropilaelaps mercedesae]